MVPLQSSQLLQAGIGNALGVANDESVGRIMNLRYDAVLLLCLVTVI